MDTKEFEHRKELCQIIKDANAELDELNAAARLAAAPKMIYAQVDMDYPAWSEEEHSDRDIKYVRADIAARLYKLFELTAGIACSCASTGPDDTIEKEIDELLDEAGWLRKPDKTGGCCDGNECEAV